MDMGFQESLDRILSVAYTQGKYIIIKSSHCMPKSTFYNWCIIDRFYLASFCCMIYVVIILIHMKHIKLILFIWINSKHSKEILFYKLNFILFQQSEVILSKENSVKSLWSIYLLFWDPSFVKRRFYFPRDEYFVW